MRYFGPWILLGNVLSVQSKLSVKCVFVSVAFHYSVIHNPALVAQLVDCDPVGR